MGELEGRTWSFGFSFFGVFLGRLLLGLVLGLGFRGWFLPVLRRLWGGGDCLWWCW